MRSRSVPLLHLAMVPLLALRTPAQITLDQGPVPVYKANARAVVVDVVVIDSQDKPVTGLRREDFKLAEDGKPEPIAYFEEHRDLAAAPVELPKMPPNIFTNVPVAPEADALNVLLLDALDTPLQDQSYVRAQVVEFLKTMKPGTPLAVFTLTTNLRLIQGFTGDPTTLLASLQDKKNGVWPETTVVSRSTNDDMDDRHHIEMMETMMGGHMTEGITAADQAQQNAKAYEAGDRVQLAAEALENIARYLARIPGRKNLIWFAGQFPISFFPVANGKGALPVGRHTGGLKPTAEQVGVQSSQLKETADLLTLSRVAIYPVGAHGVETLNSSQAQEWDMSSAGAGEALERAEIADNYWTMRELASETGGEMIRNTNDLSKAISHAIENGSHYYTLSYVPSNQNMDGQFRRIEVKIPEPKYSLSYRRGYYAIDSAQPPTTHKDFSKEKAKATPNPLQALMSRGAPSSTQLLYGVRVAPVDPQPAANATRAGKNSKLAGPVKRYGADFMIRWTDVSLGQAADGKRTGKIRVELLAYDRDGHALNWAGTTQGMVLTPDLYAAIQRSGVPAHLEIDLPSNQDVYLATGVYDVETGKAGTLEIRLRPTTNTATAKP